MGKTVTDHVRELQEDLTDGDDLAMAMKLVGDALHRRLRRAHRSIRAIENHGDVDGDRFVQLVGRIAGTLERYEADASRSRDQLQAVVDQFQELLDASVAELQDLVGDPDADGEQGGDG